MLFSSTAGWFLIGLITTAIISLFAAIGTQAHPKRLTVPLHAIIVSIYAPLIALIANPLFHFATDNKVIAWLILALTLAISVALHLFWALMQYITRLRQLLSRASSIPSKERFAQQLPPGISSGYILANCNVADYRAAVVLSEERGKEFAFIQRRIAPYMLSDEMLRLIATQRFGAGHSEMNAYVSSHQRRREAFLQALGAGAKYREVFSRKTILEYVRSGTHSEEMWPLPPTAIVNLLKNWRDTLLQYPNYYVAITDHNLPIKYHLVDDECIIIHEPVGKGEEVRLNSFFIYGHEVGKVVKQDFELIWGMTDPQWRDRQHIAQWIKNELMPIARKR